MNAAVVTIIAVLGVGNPAVHFRLVALLDPIVTAACPTRAAVVRIEADPRVRAMERAGWRLIYWDCVEGQGT